MANETANQENLFEIRDLSKCFHVRTGVAQTKQVLHAVSDVSFDIRRGEVFGLVGESGCGKSTTGRLLLQLTRPTSGSIKFDGTELTTLKPRQLKAFRARMQMVFQDPYASFDPRQTILSAIGEPLVIHGRVRNRKDMAEQVAMLLENVGLNPDAGSKYPHEFSGGQRQRIGIARALALNPDFIVADEAVSALDVSVQAQVINLLQEMKDKFNLTYLFISHDLAVILNVCDRVGVMYLGRIVEMADKRTLFSQPLHPYSQALLSAAPQIGKRGVEQVLSGEVPSPISPPKGCAFHPRCPHAKECCKEQPPMVSLPDGRKIACWMYA
ncbi:MAG: ABC transporter ATP-binding protein [Aristaeellaceae bacterium]